MPEPPLLHQDDDVLHAAAVVLHQAVAAATFDLRRCYMAVLPLLHQAAGVIQAAAAVLHVTAGIATPGRRRCYISPPACYMRPPPLHQVVGLLHYAATVATLRRRCCYMPESPVMLPAGAGDTASGRRYRVSGSAAGESGGEVCGDPTGRFPRGLTFWQHPRGLLLLIFFFVFLERVDQRWIVLIVHRTAGNPGIGDFDPPGDAQQARKRAVN
jgi:hypothetical protein